MIDSKTDAILVVDLQNDFITGSLAVPGAEDILPTVRKWVDRFKWKFFSKDVHPEKHSSFVDQEGPWPPHCVEGTLGVALHKEFAADKDLIYIAKGREVEKDEYSAFANPVFLKHLEVIGVKRLFICGLATDYCVKATVMDALEQFDGEVYILLDAIAAVDVHDGDGVAAIAEMTLAGAKTAAND